MNNKKVKRGDRIAFKAMDELGATEFTPIGIVIGFGEEVRKKYPVECAEAPDDMILVKSVHHGNLYVVHPSEVLEVTKPGQLLNLDAKRVGTVRKVE
ncbi:MAG: hypothetical protein E3J56_02310 [Candidatus Aminicenantes bacterium]|nr:MAG: hypothetical protein E3J56_02310 [Candidatus Aminicenantes bacterium]